MLNIKNLDQISKETVELILTNDLVGFLEDLVSTFEPKRQELLKRRKDNKPTLSFCKETEDVRNTSWKINKVDSRFEKRIVEITGPANQKTFVNALNSSADVFMADFEDSLTPSWVNILEGQKALYNASRGRLEFEEKGKIYKLNSNHSTKLAVRMRGLHLDEKNVELNGSPIGGGLFDFAVSFYHNAKERENRGSGFYLYLPKIEHYLEARFWSEVFDFAKQKLNFSGGIKATVLIETLPASFQMDEIIWELKDYIAGLNAGRWDYLFSTIKNFPSHPFPDRKKLTMNLPFMMSYCQLLVETCHKRGIHAIGGMSAFIPDKYDPKETEKALNKIQEDKLREVRLGFDGTWVAHPGLIETARNTFKKFLGNKDHQKDYVPNYYVEKNDLLNFPKGEISKEEKIENIKVALIYITNWLDGIAAVNINNLMEDVATAEISRIQLTKEDLDLIDQVVEENRRIRASNKLSETGWDFSKAGSALKEIIISNQEFLTLELYQHIK